MRTRSVDVVVCWAVDRLVRRVADLEEVISLAEASGVRLATVTGDLDLGTDTGRTLARILASVAQGEVERKGTRQRAANEQRAKAGRMGWTRRPFGYDRRDGVVFVVDAEAEALRDAARMVLDGETLAAACRELNRRGLWTTGHRVLRDEDGEPLRDAHGRPQRRADLPWSVKALRGALLNPRYSGRVTYRGAEITAEADWPPILDPATQERVANVLRNPQRRTAQDTAVRYWLSGLAHCGICGGSLYASPMGAKGKRWMVYKCRTPHLARRLDLVDQVVEAVVLARLTRPDVLDLLTVHDDVAALAARVRDLRSRKADLAALLREGLLDAPAVRQQATGLNAEIAALEERMTAAESSGPLAELVAADDVVERWRTLPLRDRRTVTEQLLTATVLPVTKGARFSPEQVQIKWRTA